MEGRPVLVFQDIDAYGGKLHAFIGQVLLAAYGWFMNDDSAVVIIVHYHVFLFSSCYCAAAFQQHSNCTLLTCTANTGKTCAGRMLSGCLCS
jgi:hypothetical protein